MMKTSCDNGSCDNGSCDNEVEQWKRCCDGKEFIEWDSGVMWFKNTQKTLDKSKKG